MLGWVFALVAVAGLFWLAYRRPRPRRWLIPRRPPAPRPVAASRVASVNNRLPSLLPDAVRGSLHDLLRAADVAPDDPVASAVAVGCDGFAAALRDADDPDSRLALGALTRSARSMRDGAVELTAMLRAGLGDHLAAVSDDAGPAADAWRTRALIEAERVGRRIGAAIRHVPPDVRAVLERTAWRLAGSAPPRRQCLADAPRRLIGRFPHADADEQRAILHALHDLRADISALFPEPPDRRSPWWADAVRALAWADAPRLHAQLVQQAERLLTAARPGAALVEILTALRFFPSAAGVLLGAAAHADAAIRRAAVTALAWADEHDPGRLIAVLQVARTDPAVGVRAAAVAALGRLGERAALQELARTFTADRAAILAAADAGVSWLWPDLDALADSAAPDTALAAIEAVERLRETAFGLV